MKCFLHPWAYNQYHSIIMKICWVSIQYAILWWNKKYNSFLFNFLYTCSILQVDGSDHLWYWYEQVETGYWMRPSPKCICFNNNCPKLNTICCFSFNCDNPFIDNDWKRDHPCSLSCSLLSDKLVLNYRQSLQPVKVLSNWANQSCALNILKEEK